MIELTKIQNKAVNSKGKDVLVTAGAGTGKTSTLVARYLRLMEENLSPRNIAAITFTEKAAREMRNRVRAALQLRAKETHSAQDTAFWQQLEAEMDSARIGTIHSLCAEMLRSHPAEARIDPAFEVIDEGRSLIFQAEAVEETLAHAIEDDDLSQVFRILSTNQLRNLLGRLLARRLDASLAFHSTPLDLSMTAIRAQINAFLTDSVVEMAVEELQELQDTGNLAEDAGPTLTTRILDLLEDWTAVEAALEEDDLIGASKALFHARREGLRRGAGKRDSRAKELQALLQARYDEVVQPWLGGASSSDLPPDENLEDEWRSAYGWIQDLFERANSYYRVKLDYETSLDFDDLENGALQLLKHPKIRDRWQGIIHAVLVDEFQDTNGRQRQIIDFLGGGESGKLFLVGDARQSIYRFRGADVTVFRQVEREIQARRDTQITLATTFRTHHDLLADLDALISPIMGVEDDPERLYEVPYRKLSAFREVDEDELAPPYTEIILGVGEGAGSGRRSAAAALSRRLLALKEIDSIGDWSEVALLFRASTTFGIYETSLEEAGIPFTTVSGSGFFNRPEIRDVLNVLRAISDPWNDAAMTGLLRSPAFMLSDVGLVQLRLSGEGPVPLFLAMNRDHSEMSKADRTALENTRAFLDRFLPMVDRVSVSELIKRIIDDCDYRAILAITHARGWQNLDKLVQDAQTSDLVKVRAFLQYVQLVRDVGVREGEASVEASGAVQLMTIHKAKGLEFPVVVLADMSRAGSIRREPLYLLSETGPAFSLDRKEGDPLIYRLARMLDREQAQAEENRILYVAATRARDRLLINGHLINRRNQYSTSGWMRPLLENVKFDPDVNYHGMNLQQRIVTDTGAEILLTVDEKGSEVQDRVISKENWPENREHFLYKPLEPLERSTRDDEQESAFEKDWRATGTHRFAPAAIVGVLVHEAIRRWLFPANNRQTEILQSLAQESGLVAPNQRDQAVEESILLLARFEAHPLYKEIQGAQEKYHEIPYTRPHPSWRSDSGRIDLLYKTEKGWKIVDFKTDALFGEEDLKDALKEYGPQLQRYKEAVHQLLGEEPETSICFLNQDGSVMLAPV